MKRVLRIFSSVMLAVILLILLDIGKAAYQTTESEIHFGFTRINGLVVETSSMEGKYDTWANMYKNHINAGDVIIIKQVTSPEKVNVGDVITFFKEEGEKSITHRVIAKDFVDGHWEFQTRGDANNAQDNGVVYGENIAGKYVFRIPYLGIVIKNVKIFIIEHPIFTKVCLLLAALAVLAYLVRCAIGWINKGEDIPKNTEGREAK